MKNKTTKMENAEKTENKRSVAKTIGTYLLAGALMTGIGAKLGCTDENGTKADSGVTCYEMTTEKSGKECMPKDKCGYVYLPVDSGTSKSDGAATENHKVCAVKATADASVADISVPDTGSKDSGVDAALDAAVADKGIKADLRDSGSAPDSGTGCISNMVYVAQVTADVGMKSEGKACDTDHEKCDLPFVSGNTVVMNTNLSGTSCTVKAPASEKATKVELSCSGNKTVTITVGGCYVKNSAGSTLGSCGTLMGVSPKFVEWNVDDADSTARGIVTSTLNSNTKEAMVSEGGSAKTLQHSSVLETTKVEMFKGVNGKQYLEVTAVDSTGASYTALLAVKDGSSATLGSSVATIKSVLTSDNSNLNYTPDIDFKYNKGGPYSQADGTTFLTNYTLYAVYELDASGNVDSNKSYLVVSKSGASVNTDAVIKEGSANAKNVDGKQWELVKITSNNTCSPVTDAGVAPSDLGVNKDAKPSG